MGRVVHFQRRVLHDGRVLTWCSRRVSVPESSSRIECVDCQQCRLLYDDVRDRLTVIRRSSRVDRS